MVKRSEVGESGGAWLQRHGLSVGSEVLGLSSRVLRAASSLQMQPDEPVVASYGTAKTATLTMLERLDDLEHAEAAQLAQHRRHVQRARRHRRVRLDAADEGRLRLLQVEHQRVDLHWVCGMGAGKRVLSAV